MRLKDRRGFTLIEVMVSVFIISIVVVGILKIRQQNIDAAHYISKRMDMELANTLFLSVDPTRYRGEKRNAYDLLRPMGIRNDATRRILKNISRDITVSDPLPIGEIPVPIHLRSIGLKGQFGALYYRLGN